MRVHRVEKRKIKAAYRRRQKENGENSESEDETKGF
jgi:stalled ribosome alternative rescue factor ArfA